MVIKLKVEVSGKITSQEIEIELCDKQILALGRKYLELEASETDKNGTLVSGEAISIPAAITLETTTSNSAHSQKQGITTACFSEYKPMGEILSQADNRGSEEWDGKYLIQR